MSIESTIKNMEDALEKKKAVMRERSAGKVVRLKERIETKLAKIAKLSEQVSAMETEAADLISDENVAGVETKTETFVPSKAAEGDKKDDNKKTPAGKRTASGK